MKKKLQVFISSTYNDLIEERQAAVEAILSAGHIPAGMELFSSGNESQLMVIKKWIKESDVYMLILGGRYGCLEPNTGKSYTQLEYEYAIEQGIPVFAVVMKENNLEQRVKRNGTSIIELEHRDKYLIFKNIVLSKVCRFFDDIKDIKIAIHETLHEFEQSYDFAGWVSGRDIGNFNIDLICLAESIKKFDKYTLSSEIVVTKQDNKLNSKLDLKKQEDMPLPPLLKKSEEELYVIQLLEGNEDERKDAIKVLVERNLRRVIGVVRYYEKLGDIDDLISFGTIGLIQGIRTFSSATKNDFTNHILESIKFEIENCIFKGTNYC